MASRPVRLRVVPAVGRSQRAAGRPQDPFAPEKVHHRRRESRGRRPLDGRRELSEYPVTRECPGRAGTRGGGGSPARHGLATLLAFVVAGGVPLVPYAMPDLDHSAMVSVVVTFTALVGIGALRSLVTIDRWWTAGLEMLGLGFVVAVAADAAGALAARFVPGIG